MSPAEYLRKPYGRVVVPETDGTYRAEIIEFPGCIATGDSAAAALSRLEDVAESWLGSVIAKNQPVPEPMGATGYSGKLVVRLPRSLHRRAAQHAASDGTSLNQFIVACIAEKVGARWTVAQSSHAVFVTTVNANLGVAFSGTVFTAATGAVNGITVGALPNTMHSLNYLRFPEAINARR